MESSRRIFYNQGWDNVPKNVKVLSEKEALMHQQKLISNWKKPSEVFFLKYGSIISGFVTAVSALPIIDHFRKQFRLNKFGLIATYFPGSAMPAFLTMLGYNKLVTTEIMLMKMQCPLCMQFKYAAYHLCSSLVYSTLITAMACSSIALRRKTRYVPPPHTEGKQYIKFFWDMIKAGSRRYQAVSAFQLVAVFLLPYIQIQEFSNLMESIGKQEGFTLDSKDPINSELLVE